MILQGDSLEVLRTLEENSVDSICTDPPYGYSFMGKDWDKAVPSVDIWRECLRVLKPGGWCMVMSAPRSDVQNAMISRLMEAGFRLDFTPIYWTYASGFPKAGNVGKLVDKRLGAEREVLGVDHAKARRNPNPKKVIGQSRDYSVDNRSGDDFKLTAATTDQAKALDGSYTGFQPKPAVEVIIVAMKPLSEKTYVDQALKNGKGITWLDDCRVPGEPQPFGNPTTGFHDSLGRNKVKRDQVGDEHLGQGGRFPANLLVENSILSYNRCTCTPEVNTQTQQQDLQKDELGIRESLKQTEITSLTENLEAMKQNEKSPPPLKDGRSHQNTEQPSEPQGSHSLMSEDVSLSEALIGTEPTESGCKPSTQETDLSADSAEQPKTSTTTTSNPGRHIPTFGSTLKTDASCALHATARPQPGASKPSDSNYSRFFDLDKWWAKTLPFLIVPKASKSEKNKGLDSFDDKNAAWKDETRLNKHATRQSTKNHHPTVKPLKLMSYLITLTTREGDTVLDPFVGSGTTVVAATQLERIGIGIEREAEYAEIALARLAHEDSTPKQESLL